MGDLITVARGTIEKFGLLKSGDTVVVAVSGGPDSTALLHLLADLRDECALTLHVAHLNHGLRPDAGADAEFVRKLAAALRIPSSIETADVRALASAERRSVEDAGRQARYAFFARTAAAVGASRVATAHTRDDQVETVAMRLLQGAAWDALAGIPEARPLGSVTVIRPLLEATRTGILEYLRARGIAWRDDPTNRDQRILRNWVRLTWLPALDAGHPEGRVLLRDAALVARGAERFLGMAAEAVVAGARRQGRTIQFPLETFRSLPPDVRRRVMHLAARQVAGTELTPADVVAVGAGDAGAGHVGREVRLSGCVIRRGYDVVEVASVEPAPVREYRLPVPGRVEAGDFGVIVTAEVVERNVMPDLEGGGENGVYLDAEAVGAELVVRPWRPGDRFSPLGLRGTKKVHDIFVDKKVPRWERSRIPLVADRGGRILWIVGVAIADPAKVTAASSRVVRLRARGVRDAGRIAGRMTAGADRT